MPTRAENCLKLLVNFLHISIWILKFSKIDFFFQRKMMICLILKVYIILNYLSSGHFIKLNNYIILFLFLYHESLKSINLNVPRYFQNKCFFYFCSKLLKHLFNLNNYVLCLIKTNFHCNNNSLHINTELPGQSKVTKYW